jgi:hypothetical protein
MNSLKIFGSLIVITMYSAAYAENTLCEKNEIAVWSCETKKKIFSLCASSDIGLNSGYMQYRAGHRGRIGFRYPAALRHPRDVFKLEYLARDGRFRFVNKGYEYEITDLLIGPTEINISKNKRQVAQIDCSRADPSILDTPSIDLFKSAGLSE